MKKRIAGFVALALCAACAPPTAEAPEGTATPEMSEAANAAVEAWRQAVADAREEHPYGPEGAPWNELETRFWADVTGRNALVEIMKGDLAPEDREQALAEVWNDLNAIDAANTDYVKSQIPAEGWPKISELGFIPSGFVWLLVQHSPDHEFQADALARMEPLLAEGEVHRQNYAYLYDRVEMHAGRPQLYGSQARCSKDGDGVLEFYQIEDRKHVDERRAEMGLEPLAEYAERFGVSDPC